MGKTQFQMPVKSSGGKALNTLDDVLADNYKCVPCRCDECTGIESVKSWNPDGTYEILGRYYVEGAVVVEPMEDACANVKAIRKQL